MSEGRKAEAGASAVVTEVFVEATVFEKALDPQYFFSFPRYCRFLLKAGLVAPERVERILPKKPMLFPG